MRRESEKISIRMDEELLKDLNEEVKISGRDRSEYIRQSVKEKLYRKNNQTNVECLCRLSTLYTHIIEECDLPEEKKSELRKELELAWRK